MATIILFSVLTGTYAHTLLTPWLQRMGFALRNFGAVAQWRRVVTSVVMTWNPRGFAQALLVIAVGVGGVERRLGSGWAALLFWGLHLVTLLVLALLFSLPVGEMANRTALFASRDVGSSAGYFGSLAVFLSLLGGRWHVLNALIFLGLGGTLLLSLLRPSAAAVLGANLAHVVTFGLGWALGSFVLKRFVTRP